MHEIMIIITSQQ